jgi:hypothetical protein
LLDLTLLGISKTEGTYRLPFDELTKTTNLAYHMDIMLGKTLTHPNIWAAFNTIGVIFHTGEIPSRVAFHPEKLRESQGFPEFWGIDHGMVFLTLRRRNTRLGWLKKP